MTIIYRNANSQWLLESPTRLEPGVEVTVTKKDGSTKIETVGEFVSSNGYGFRYAIAREQRAAAPTVKVGNLAGILELFDRARKHLKNPAIVLGIEGGRLIRITVAGDRAKHPGTLNVVDGDRQEWDPYAESSGREWYGRVHLDGSLDLKRTYRGTPLAARIEAKLVAFATAPAQVAAEHGRLTGRCCFCNRPLTDERSTAVGYGQTCAGHYGMPWGSERHTFSADEPALPFSADEADLKEGAVVEFTTKYGYRATGIYLGPDSIPRLGEGRKPIQGHLVLSDDCFGPDHSAGEVRCFIDAAPKRLGGAEAQAVRERFAARAKPSPAKSPSLMELAAAIDAR